MSNRREPFLESIFDLLGKQDAVIATLQKTTGFTEDTWLAFQSALGDASKGFLSEDTTQLLFIVDEYKLYDVPRLLMKLKQKLFRDFNLLRKVFVEKGLLAKAFETGRPSTLSHPKEWGSK